MKRAALLIIILLVCIIGYLSVQGTVPFVPVSGSAMEPAIKSGNLILEKHVKPADIAAGDIVIFKVPASIRENYDYPPVLARRVVEVIKNQTGISFRVQDVNAYEEPVLVRPQDIKGEAGTQIPYLGFSLMIFQSTGTAALIFVLIFLIALYLYSREISVALGKRYRAFLSPVIEQNNRVNDALSKRVEGTEKALTSFASAMQEYARHMASHTSAVKGLSEASHALKDSAAEQNRILNHMTASLIKQKKGREVTRIEEITFNFRQRTREILKAKEALEKEILVQARKNPDDTILIIKIPPPQGCVVKPKALLEKRHFYSVGPKVAI